MKPCIMCKNGKLVDGSTTFATDSGELLVVIRKVPALVCQTCGEEYLDQDVTRQLLQEVENSIYAAESVVIREYEAA